MADTDYQQVTATALKYVEYAANGESDKLAQVFDVEFGDVKMINIDSESGKEVLRTVPLRQFAGFFTTATKETWKADLLSVDIVDHKMAMVKLNFTTAKNHYVDYLVMYKRNDVWRIVNKTFVAKAKQ